VPGRRPGRRRSIFNNDRNMDEPDERDYQRLQLDLKF